MDIATLEKKYKENSAQKEVDALQKKLAKLQGNSGDLSKLSKDLAYFSDLARNISEIQEKIKNLKDAKYMVENENDPEIKELATEEIESLESEIESLDKEIRKMKIAKRFSSEDDSKAVILEIRAGAGGDEASLFASDLFRMYKNYAFSKNWQVQLIDSSVSESGGYKEVIAEIKGKNVFKDLKYESGVHRVQRVPVTESSGRIHTSTASVAVLPEAKEIDVQINPEDIHVEVMRASGAGGQCVNRTDSAVRITHLPTGIVVSCQETKHQTQNREKAMALLRARLYEKKRQEEASKRDSLRSDMIGSAMRAEKIRTYNFPQNRITDHRIKKSWFNIESVLNGNLDEIINDVREGITTQLLEETERSERKS
jgi:peptide chain release factor 1